jgi:RNA 3'-phosphate cyclase
MVHIDGSLGEGGGQVLRSSLTLSILTGKALHMTNIRARRSKPGLGHQHLNAVQAATAVSKARVEGDRLGSQTLTFHPGEIQSGRYNFDIGTAGSTSLVLQTIFLPLSRAGSASTVAITGGTHVPWSPSFHYLELHWMAFMRRCGFDALLDLNQAGFYPRGGGKIQATLRPAQSIAPLQIKAPGELQRIQGLSMVSNLSWDIASRQKRQARRRIAEWGPDFDRRVKIKNLQAPSPGKGTMLLLLAEFEHGQCCYFGLGERGKPAERVADEAVDGLQNFLQSGAAIDQYLADQLLLPLALAEQPSELHTSQITQHLVTNADVLRAFMDVKIEIEGEMGQPGWVRIWPPGSI